jgi:hypothetical protein
LQDISFLEVAENGDEPITSGKKGVSDSTAAAKTVFQVTSIYPWLFVLKTNSSGLFCIVQPDSSFGNERRA